MLIVHSEHLNATLEGDLRLKAVNPARGIFNLAVYTLGIQSSNKMIIARLNELGLRPARGDAWTTSTVDNMKRRMKRMKN